ERLRALMQQALELGQEGCEPRGRRASQYGRDKAFLEHDLSIGASLDDMRDRNLRKVLAGLALQHEARVQCRDGDLRRDRGVRAKVPRLVIPAAIACELGAVGLARGLQGTRLLQWDRKAHELIAHVGADFERRGKRVVLRHRERRAVRKYAASAPQSE